ncbi:hypothetical protein ACHAWF_002596 [Thalassiosira exigua]
MAIRSISDLCDDTLAHVASYLPCDPASRLLLSAALSGSRAFDRRQRATWRAIAPPPARQGRERGNGLTLDFATLDAALASRLTDDDLRSVLVCARSSGDGTMKVRLMGCTGICGSGLDVLRGGDARDLEQLDLRVANDECGLFGRVARFFQRMPGMREDEVLPILWSIVEVPGASLRHLRLPRVWMTNRSKQLDRFLEMYERHMNGLTTQCSKADDCRSCADSNECWDNSLEAEKTAQWIGDGGNQLSTCYSCLKNAYQHPNRMLGLRFCPACDRHFCQRCSIISGCKWCSGAWCHQ